MKLNKSASYVLLHMLNGSTTTPILGKQLPIIDVRSIQRALVRLTELGLISRDGRTSPSYSINYKALLSAPIDDKLLEDENRPTSLFRHDFLAWLAKLPKTELAELFSDREVSSKKETITARELEHLTVELSWKSSALEGNTYTLLDTQLLLLEGVKAKNKTEFETQMILNHKNAIAFIMENPELFTATVEFKTLEELHKLIGYNLGIDTGIRKRLVKITASNYEPLSDPHKIRESMDTVLEVISHVKNPFARAILALALIPYLQAFEDGNKRTGRMLANALLIHSIGQGFSMRNVQAKQLALAYLSFYEFGSIHALANILHNELRWYSHDSSEIS